MPVTNIRTDQFHKIHKKTSDLARAAAFKTLESIFTNKLPLDRSLNLAINSLDSYQDKKFHRQLVMTTLRHSGELDLLLKAFVQKPLKGHALRVLNILRLGMVQLLYLRIPSYAAVSSSVTLARTVGVSGHAAMVNAILRRCMKEANIILKGHGKPALNIPKWLMRSWEISYGPIIARKIATSSLQEPALDLSIKSNTNSWANTLGGKILRTGSIRIHGNKRIDTLPGYSDGAWWVQDAAASLPVHLFSCVRDKRIADICAAPGGKTAQLASMGASVLSIDISETRIKLLEENMRRLKFTVNIIKADATKWQPNEKFDAILLDAPCTATGTLRRNPDIKFFKSPTDVMNLAKVQLRMLENTINFLKPGGELIYCTCSLQPEEGRLLINKFVAHSNLVSISRVQSKEVFNIPDIITKEGYIQTLPFQLCEDGGWDGFFIARLKRN